MILNQMDARRVPLLIALLGIVIYLLYIAVLLMVADNNLLGLISFGEHFVDGETAGIASEFIRPRTGYDGQMYYRLAQDPFSIQQTAFGITLDDAPLRQQRMLLPLLTSIFTQGNVAQIPIVMLLINIFAVGGCGWAAAHIISRFDCSPWYGLLFAFYPGFSISVARFLTEPLAFLLMLLSLLALLKRRNLLAAVMLSFAVLTRETATLLVAAGFFTWAAQLYWKPSASQSKLFRPTSIYWLLPSFTFLLWQIWLYQQWGRTFLNSARQSTFGIPGNGIVDSVVYNISNFDPANFLYLLMILILIVYLAYVFPKITKIPDLLSFSFYAYLAFAICVGINIWVASPGFLRVFTELNLIGLLSYLIVHKRIGKALPLGWISIWLITAAAEWYRLAYWQQHFTPPSSV